MKRRLGFLIVLLVAAPALLYTLTAQGQSACSVEELLAELDIVSIERRIEGCDEAAAAALVTQAQTTLDSTESPTEIARLHTIMALAYAAQGNDYDARITMQQALLDWRNARDGVMESRVLYYLGKFHEDARQHDQAETYYSQALRTAERNDDTFTQGRVILAYGRYELSLGNNENALGLLEDSLPLLLENPLIAVPEQIENLQLLSRVSDIFEKYGVADLYRRQASFLSSNPNWYSEVVGSAAVSACPFETVSDQQDILAVEHGLPNCLLELPKLLEETQSTLDATNEPAERARLQTIAGLIYFANNDAYNASLNHERALLQFREVGDRKMESWTLFYMARAYFGRRQFGSVLSYLGQSESIADEVDDVFQIGRAKLLQTRYEIEVNNDYSKAALIAEEGLKSLQAAGEMALPEQIQMLQLLNQIYSTLGDLEKAGNYLRLVQSLQGLGADQADNSASSLVGVNNCQVNNLVNQFDVVYVERQMQLCVGNLPGLMLTAQTMVLTAPDARSQGVAQLYVGIGHYFRNDVLTAYIELDRAVVILRQVGDARLLGYAYLYLALNERAKSQTGPAATYFEQARTTWEQAGDNFNLGRVYLELGKWELEKGNYTLSVTYLERALANIQSSPTYSYEEQASALSTLIFIHQKHIQNEQRVLEYQQQLDSLYERPVVAVQPTAAPNTTGGDAVSTEAGTEASPATTTACDLGAIVAEADLVVAEKMLAPCSERWEDLLFQVESARQQADTEENIAHFQNFLGIVYYYLADYPNAIIEHNRALTRYRNLGNGMLEGRSLYYAGRSYLANGQTGEATSFLSQARRIATNGNDARGVALVALLYGNQAYDERDMEEALEQYQIALEQLEVVNDARDTITTVLRLGQIEDERSNFGVVEGYYNQAAELAEQVEDTSSFVLAKVGLARFQKYFGRFQEALENAQAALSAAQNDTDKAIARAEVANVSRLMEDYEAARDLLALDPNTYDCEIGDQIRLYTAAYYIAIGRASNALEQVRPLFEASTCPNRSPLTVAHAYAAIADAQLLRRRSDTLVIDAINAAMREYDGLNYPRGYQSARIQMATYQFYLRDYAEAERWLSTAEKKALEVSDLRSQADIAMVRVEISIDRGRYGDALEFLAAASDIYNQLEFVPGLSSTLEQRLRIFLDQARYDEAIELIEFAQENYGSLSISFGSRIAFYQGRYYQQIGQSELALTYYDQALTGFLKAQEILSIVDVQLQRARILQQRGQLDAVVSLLNDLRPLVNEQENNYYLAQIDAVTGDNYVLVWSSSPTRTSGDESVQQAQQFYQQALDNYTLVNNVAGLATVNNSLSKLELLRVEASLDEPQRYRGTTAPAQRSLEMYRTIDNSLGVADALYNLGRFFLLTGEYDSAESYFYQALDEVGDNDPMRRANILTGLGLTYEYKHVARGLAFGAASNDLYLAVEQYREAARLLSFTYAEIADEDTQRQFGTQSQTLAPYNRLLRIYAVYTLKDQTSDAIDALFYAEQSRARSYLTQLQGEQINVGDSEESSALNEWQTLRSEVISLNQLLQEINARSGDAAETENIQNEVNSRLERMQALEGELQLSSLQQFVSVQVTDLASIQSALPDNTMMVIYYVLPAERTPRSEEAARILMLLISKDNITKVSQRVPDFQQDLLNQIDGFLRTHSPVAADRLYKMVVSPIAEQIAPYSHLVIVPHNVLNYVPFEALTDGDGQPLVMSFDTSYVPSGTVYTLLRNTVKLSDHEGILLGLGYSGEAQQLPPLTYYADELNGISSSISNVELFMEEDATESRLTDIANVDVIHIAAHGRFDSLNPLSSFIALAPGDENDGLLEVREVYQLSLKEQNPLITLSACELAISQVNPGDELEGMTRAFLLTGARGVIASMWPVDDFITSELMQAFYQNRADGMTNAEALTAAKRMIHELYGDTYLWAGFVLVGLEN